MRFDDVSQAVEHRRHLLAARCGTCGDRVEDLGFGILVFIGACLVAMRGGQTISGEVLNSHGFTRHRPIHLRAVSNWSGSALEWAMPGTSKNL
jgi:hypothetical protein